MTAFMIATMPGHRRRAFIYHREPVCFDQSEREASINLFGWLIFVGWRIA